MFRNVLDCSAAIAIASGSPEGQALQSLISPGEKTFAPTLFQAELANAAFRRIVHKHEDASLVKAEVACAMGLVDEFVDTQDLMSEVIAESIRFQHPAYDMFYFVLARRMGACVMTLDKKLMRLCIANGVNCIWDVQLDQLQ